MAIPLIVPLISAGISAAGSIFGAVRAGEAQEKAEAAEKENRKEMDRLKGIYSNLDTSNPYLNMENTMEDLTINQKQAEFTAQQNQQTQANTLDTLRSSAGGSGVAALAQSMAQQGQLSAQRASASIGKQEAANQMASAREAGRLQTLERKGDILSRNMERDQAGTLLGMSQQETAASRQQAAMAQQAKFNAISSGIKGISGAVTAGMKYGAFDNLGSYGGSDVNSDQDLSNYTRETYSDEQMAGMAEYGFNPEG